MLLTKPLSTSDSMAAQVSLKGGTTSGPASSELGLNFTDEKPLTLF